MKITKELLNSLQACEKQVCIFEKEWPNGCEVTRTNIDRAIELRLDLYWLASYLFPKAIDSAWKAYSEAVDSAWKTYNEATAPAYDETISSAKKAYHEAVASAEKVYDEAIINILLMSCLKLYSRSPAGAIASL